MKLLIQLTPSLIFIFFCTVPAWIVLKFYNNKIKRRKSPINIELLRNAGDSIQEKINNINDEIIFNLFLLPIIPIIIYSLALSNFVPPQKEISALMIIIYISIILLSTIYFGKKVYELINERNKLRLGLECEKAIGQCLSVLLKYGFNVYHDLQADNFNIDHVAVGHTGIFSIETKGRSKLLKAENNNWKVDFDGKRLIFPGWEETKPINQTINQSKWLKKFIQDTTGEKINVTPVIALSGWYITRKEKSSILTINGKNIDFIAKGARVLTDKQIQSISFQIKSKCIDNSPKSYQKIAQQSH